MTRYMMMEHDRLAADIVALDERLAKTKPAPGLRARSVHSFLSQLRRHKREMLKDLDSRIAEEGSASSKMN